MEAKINSMSEETAGRLIESFERARIVSQKSIDTLQETFETLIKTTHLQLQTYVAEYTLKVAKGNLFTKWYYKRQLKKYTEKLHLFETEFLPKYNAIK